MDQLSNSCVSPPPAPRSKAVSQPSPRVAANRYVPVLVWTTSKSITPTKASEFTTVTAPCAVNDIRIITPKRLAFLKGQMAAGYAGSHGRVCGVSAIYRAGFNVSGDASFTMPRQRNCCWVRDVTVRSLLPKLTPRGERAPD